MWDEEEHIKTDILTTGSCFNHIVGLPTKDEIAKPLFTANLTWDIQL
jgi:hypothetical protein